MITTHVPGNWVPDKWSRGGKVAYKGEAKCDWRRRMSNDGKQIVRLIQYKGMMILQKAVMLGAEDEQEEQEEEEEEEQQEAAAEAEEEAEEEAPPAKEPSKAKKGKGKKTPEAEAPQDAPRPKRAKR